MVQINYALNEVNSKIVYYGPWEAGKTTNLLAVRAEMPPAACGEMVSISTQASETLYFDFMPLELGTIAGMKTKFQLYSAPGKDLYNATRKLVLEGCDGIVFVADSDPARMESNHRMLDELAQNLSENGLDIQQLPIVLQFNKRDLPNAVPIEELNARLNRGGWPTVESVAASHHGVLQTLKTICRAIIARQTEARPAQPVPVEPVEAAASLEPAVAPSPVDPLPARPARKPKPKAPPAAAVAPAAPAFADVLVRLGKPAKPAKKPKPKSIPKAVAQEPAPKKRIAAPAAKAKANPTAKAKAKAKAKPKHLAKKMRAAKPGKKTAAGKKRPALKKKRRSR